MQLISKYIIICSLFFGLAVFFPEKADAQYRVSGLVEFSYRDYESKIGGQAASSYSIFTQNYLANISSSVLDPRFLMFQGGVGYTITSYSNASDDTHGLFYNLNASFFAASKVSLDLFGAKSVTSVPSQPTMGSYDITSTSYGGLLKLNLSRGNNYRNNNNNNNNNNNTSHMSRGSFPLPDITVYQNHSEMESLSAVSPVQQERDDTRMSMQYRVRRTEMRLDGRLEKFNDLILNSDYDTKTLLFNSQSQLRSDIFLGLDARLMDRTTTNFAGFNPREQSQAYGARLDFAEKNRIQQYYRYDYTSQENQYAFYTTNAAVARVTYRALASLSLHGGLTYGLSDYAPKQNVNQASYKLENMGLLAGAAYSEVFKPAFLDPFTAHANYEFNLGYTSVTTAALASSSGNGLYYTNTVGAGVLSSGWKTETLGAEAMYSSKRDHSAAGNDIQQQRYSLNATTTRLPKTDVRFSANYDLQVSSTNATNVFLQQSSSQQQRRSLIFHLDANYTALPDLTLGAGASRDQTTSNTTTLATIGSSSASYLQTLFYGTAAYHRMLTRSLQFRTDVREEYRIDNFNNTENRTHRFNANLDYRIRMIYVSLEYHWQQDIPDFAPRITQETIFTKLSRPF